MNDLKSIAAKAYIVLEEDELIVIDELDLSASSSSGMKLFHLVFSLNFFLNF